MAKFLIIFITILALFASVHKAQAYVDPLSSPNNKMGIHILFPTELSKASQLVNTSGGDWGYVTIPIQAGDRDLDKWQKFMDDAKIFHIIPILRLATQGDYFNTKVWSKPTREEVLDFANFLDSLRWPTKNRYIIVFNEVNRADEWNGDVNPQEYAEILSFSTTAFKSKNQDFFIISAGMDNAAATAEGQSMSQYDYFREMNKWVPGIFNQVDGISSHSYPNPGFSSHPSAQTTMSIKSFIYEKEVVESMSSKKFQVFITETGWSKDAIPESVIADYYKYAYENAWQDPSIVAITPFLLQATGQPFGKFSFIDAGQQNRLFEEVAKITKVKGEPILAEPERVLGESKINKKLAIKKFEDKDEEGVDLSMYYKVAVPIGKWLLRL